MYYYDKSEDARSRRYRGQYYFGGQMIVAPVTRPAKPGRPNVEFYLPPGRWTHFFTRKVYEGGRYGEHCAPEDYPVFVKEGAVIPLLPEKEGNGTGFEELEVLAFAGKGSYTLYDEDGGKIEFTLDGEDITVAPSENCSTKKVTVTFVNSEKENETFVFGE
jgi:alpha-glucosidase (family GH31 glycosyl hydrolase)